MTRRSGVLLVLVGAVVASLPSCGRSDNDPTASQRVLILGIDGMDPKILDELMERGRMPNFARLAASGSLHPLGTSMPPQSPVAWSNFISGADPGVHQLYDFIHRDPAPDRGAILPFLSTSTVEPPSRDWALSAGKWRVPLFGEKTRLLRQGSAFWDDLLVHGVDCTIYRMPANYPPPESAGSGRFLCMCGMGTPDLMGSYGEFTFFTPTAPFGGRLVGGGRFVRLRLRDHHATAILKGPGNYLRTPNDRGAVEELKIDFDIARDPVESVAKITIGDEVVLLNEGEWSDWVQIDFETGIPGSLALEAMQLPTSMPAIVRFYLKQVHPGLELYVTPLNIDPTRQINPVGTPTDFPEQVAQSCGLYYTTGIPEDTKALRSGALNEDEFISQVRVLVEERFRQYRYALQQFDRGCLFFYFGHIDQLSHIFWRDRDAQHPAHDPAEAAKYGTVIEDAYVEMDGLVGEAIAALDDDDTLIVMSDHGFTSFRRGFNLNTWLLTNGYLTLTDPDRQAQSIYLSGVDWSATQAYALGLNALYLNMAGREKNGMVQPGEDRRALLKRLAAELTQVRDADGTRVIDSILIVEDAYPQADPSIAPDLLIGYADTYRASWATAEGGMPQELFQDNFDRWSGDHCIDASIVPGILLTNRKITMDDPTLSDLAPTILALFGIDAPDRMTGRNLLSP